MSGMLSGSKGRIMVDASRWISGNVAQAQLSAIKEMAVRSARVPGAASLTWGLPSFATPEHIRRAVSEALVDDPDAGKYTLPAGLLELRELVAQRHEQATGISVDPERNILITAGNMQGMSTLFHTLLDPGDEVILTDPGFASHIQQIRLAGGVPVHWPLQENSGWRLDLQALPPLISGRTKALVLVTPSNPTGSVFPREDLLQLGEIARERGIMLILDDPYSELVYDADAPCFNLASEAALSEQLAYLFTFSKIHAMSGWRLGYMIVPDWLRQQVLKVHDANLICAPRPSQIAGMAALAGSRAHVDEFRRVLATRRDLICQRLDRVPHVFEYVRPQGAYYVFPKIVAKHEDSMSFALGLLEKARVTVTPGSAFGPSGEHHVRMAYCVDDAVINTAFDRIEARHGAAR